MADRLTELQDAINLQAENLCNAIGVIQQVAQPSFFSDFNWASRSVKPEYQAFIQSQPTDDIARSFAVAISATAKQLDTLIGALPEEEASADIQRATVHKLLEGYRAEGAKLARITTKLESRYTENFMEPNSNPPLSDPSLKVPESIYLSSTSSPSHDSWITHLTILFLLILFFRLCFTFGVVDRLHALVNYILMISTPSGRKRRALRAKYVEDLDNLRNQLKSVHMVDEFATYSKLERKIKLLERQLDVLAPETFVGSMVRQFSIYVGLYAIEALSVAYLISRSPEKSIAPETIQSILKTDYSMKNFIVLLCSVISYIPAKILVICWVILCRLTVGPAVTKLGSKLQRPTQYSGSSFGHNMNTTPTYSTTSNTTS
ncbi:Mediator of RNA polymerase II transcription subunit 21 [Schistosoma japonicum]|nr:Mediator of RNA polymerase II transcription subunit 21 [Schistosoma japonicum]KAH8855698.1 Mediator of RNA polymerase II transcription subunit 21 [Schistosoma japonicum]KAH8855699.1 Mediator of RNA polymerase II transcription subunit 21 [Schistosoma japonicum]